MKYYKVLQYNRACCHGGKGSWEPQGVPMPEIVGKLVPCQNGYHVCTADQLLEWIGPMIWEVDVDTTGMLTLLDKVVVRGATLRSCTAWNVTTMPLWAIDCAMHVQHLAVPETVALNTATWRYLTGEATLTELNAASNASYMKNLRRDKDTSYAAWITSYAAGFACDAARYAERYEGRHANDAACYAARHAASEARTVFNEATAAAAERAWQTNRLLYYL